jgi:hypothetical protein
MPPCDDVGNRSCISQDIEIEKKSYLFDIYTVNNDVPKGGVNGATQN